jgi:uncharacterized spore protein YtfJ
MKVFDTLQSVPDAITVKRVFGDPIVRDGATVVPVAFVSGAGGGGGGSSAEGEGGGVGFGLTVRPLGALVIRDDSTRFVPILHPTDLLRAATAFLAVLTVFRAFRRR